MRDPPLSLLPKPSALDAATYFIDPLNAYPQRTAPFPKTDEFRTELVNGLTRLTAEGASPHRLRERVRRHGGIAGRLGSTNLAQARPHFDTHPDGALLVLFTRLA